MKSMGEKKQRHISRDGEEKIRKELRVEYVGRLFCVLARLLLPNGAVVEKRAETTCTNASTAHRLCVFETENSAISILRAEH